MPNAFLGAGLAKGAQQGYRDNFSADAQAARAEARARKEAGEQKLAQLKATKPTEQDLQNMKTVQLQEIELLKQQNKQAIAQNAQQITYSGFDRYIDADYDPRMLNSMLKDLKQNPAIGHMYQEYTRVDALTDGDKDLITKAGLDAELILNNPDIKNQFVKTVRADGSVRVDDVTELMKRTGYYRYARPKELQRQASAAKLYNQYVTTGARTETERTASGLALKEGLEPGTPEFETRRAELVASLRTRDSGNRRGGTATDPGDEYRTKDEREAYRRAEAKGFTPGTEDFELAFGEEYASIIKRNRQTAVGKQEDQVDAAKTRIDNAVPEGKTFWDLDMSNAGIRRKFERDIEKMERFGNLDFDAAEKKELRNIAELISLGAPAGELTEKETGLVDSVVRSFKKYVSDEVGGAGATSAYNAFRNSIRHALYGAALTEGEIRAFNDQFGNLKQQAGPVLKQFVTSLNQVKAKLESIKSMNNSYVTHYRLGVNSEELDNIINAINQRVEVISRIQSGDTSPTESKLSPAEFNEMDALLKESSYED